MTETTDFLLAELVHEHTFMTGFAQRIHQQSEVELDASDMRRLTRRVPLYIEALRAADLLVTVQFAEAVLRELSTLDIDSEGGVTLVGTRLGDVQMSMLLIVEGIRAELNTKSFVAVPPSKRHLFEDGKHYGDAVADRFPGLAFNINEAGKCMALGRWTAATFHSILCLEGAIRALTRHLLIPDPTTGAARNWSAIGRTVHDEMQRRWPPPTGPSDPHFKKVDRIFGALRALQNPYRNETMHLSASYSESEAAFHFEVIKGILQEVASICDEEGNPKLP